MFSKFGVNCNYPSRKTLAKFYPDMTTILILPGHGIHDCVQVSQQFHKAF